MSERVDVWTGGDVIAASETHGLTYIQPMTLVDLCLDDSVHTRVPFPRVPFVGEQIIAYGSLPLWVVTEVAYNFHDDGLCAPPNVVVYCAARQTA